MALAARLPSQCPTALASTILLRGGWAAQGEFQALSVKVYGFSVNAKYLVKSQPTEDKVSYFIIADKAPRHFTLPKGLNTAYGECIYIDMCSE